MAEETPHQPVVEAGRQPVLQVEGLSVALENGEAVRPVVDNVSFAVQPGEVVSLVGESGCGKSVTALAVMRLLPPKMRMTAGRIDLDNQDIAALPERSLQSIRGRVMSLIFQDPMSSLNPLMTVGAQIAESLIVHRKCGAGEARDRAIDLLAQVKLPSPRERAGEYPHRLSGGMRQRVMIAIALACEPRLIIADEPTTALDVTIQRQIIDLLRDLQSQRGIGLLLITHDIGLVAEMADRVLVMYAGRIVERAAAKDILRNAVHPYTKALLASMPAFSRDRIAPADERLTEIKGVVPPLSEQLPGCCFQPRCPVSFDACTQDVPSLRHVARSHRTACLRVAEPPL